MLLRVYYVLLTPYFLSISFLMLLTSYFPISHFLLPMSYFLFPDRNPPERKLPRFWKPFGLPEGLARA